MKSSGKLTPTGRVERGPNMQGIPVRTPEGRAIRDATVKVRHVPGTSDSFEVTRVAVKSDLRPPEKFSTANPPRSVADIHSVRELPVPPSLLNSIACSRATFELVIALIDGMPRLEAELAAARRKGAVNLARAYVVLYKLNECLARLYGDSDGKDGSGLFKKLFEKYKKEVVPDALDLEGVQSLPLDEGMRVGTRTDTRASVRGDRKSEAYMWLRKNYPDLLSTSVNASTLSSLAGKLMSEDNVDLPEDLFNVAYVPTTTVTIARKK